MHPCAPRLGADAQERTQVRDRVPAGGHRRLGALQLAHPPFDPRPQLSHGGGGLALGGAAGEHDLDAAAGVHGHADATGAL